MAMAFGNFNCAKACEVRRNEYWEIRCTIAAAHFCSVNLMEDGHLARPGGRDTQPPQNA